MVLFATRWKNGPTFGNLHLIGVSNIIAHEMYYIDFEFFANVLTVKGIDDFENLTSHLFRAVDPAIPSYKIVINKI